MKKVNNPISAIHCHSVIINEIPFIYVSVYNCFTRIVKRKAIKIIQY